MTFLRQALERYTLLEATTAEEALRRFKDNQRGIGLLIADVSLPISSGIQVALLLRQENPDLPVILTSGYPVDNWSVREFIDLAKLGADSAKILRKPFQAQHLLNCVLESIGELPEVAITA